MPNMNALTIIDLVATPGYDLPHVAEALQSLADLWGETFVITYDNTPIKAIPGRRFEDMLPLKENSQRKKPRPPHSLSEESPSQRAKRLRAITTASETRRVISETFDETLPYLHSLRKLHTQLTKPTESAKPTKKSG